MCRMVTHISHLGVGGARSSSGRHGWIVFCVHLSYFNLEYLSHLIFILIPLWRGFNFSEDMLSNVHTADVSYRRGFCYLSTIFCPSSVKKQISDFWDLNQGPKSRLQSSRHSSASPPPPAEAINITYHPLFGGNSHSDATCNF